MVIQLVSAPKGLVLTLLSGQNYEKGIYLCYSTLLFKGNKTCNRLHNQRDIDAEKRNPAEKTKVARQRMQTCKTAGGKFTTLGSKSYTSVGVQIDADRRTSVRRPMYKRTPYDV